MAQTKAHTAAGTVGARIAEERARQRLTQAELAEALGVSRNSVSLYEADKYQPGADSLVRLHQLGADIVYILTGQSAVKLAAESLDMDRLALALEESRRQLGLPDEAPGQRAILDRAWAIYLALGRFLASEAR